MCIRDSPWPAKAFTRPRPGSSGEPPFCSGLRKEPPKVIIPVFPGTNCEYDTAHAFARAGADPEVLVIRNLTPADVTASCEALVKACLLYTSRCV